MKNFLPVVFLAMSLAGCHFLGLTKDKYNLQDRCEKQCEEWSKSYQRKYPSDKISYEYHYNKPLNKCFMLVNYEKSQLKSLKNISENKIYGSFLSKKDSKTIICNVLEKKCKTEQEWNLLIKPYLAEWSMNLLSVCSTCTVHKTSPVQCVIQTKSPLSFVSLKGDWTYLTDHVL